MSSRIVAPSASHAEELQAIRRHLGLSQRRFACLLAITPRSLSRWERGAKSINLTVLRLARFYALRAVPPMQFLPTPATYTIVLNPSNGCLWQSFPWAGACSGACYTLQVQVSRRRILVNAACNTHLWRGYLDLEAELRAHEKREAYRQARIATRRRASEAAPKA